ncbi:uncharacterized protein CELE_M04C3.5 [Caenorhabditis elegans]|uniref:Uncharacterized protein n=1 Tax=Caenorhabditis elegans TaxID=6239 RepID=G1K103_CAEEL|nr:Uncharacterized protein CELE_M04C3.5 [Caenorhabditis elegans]CCC42190.1 Uncharacterized protein CELE_M04C3.5 [Caenorhabditis elegans]|eukprot:NP_001256863.1 Uncharacterized protein CELE_M04C3.5 [Caenorhabditis elegans]
MMFHTVIYLKQSMSSKWVIHLFSQSKLQHSTYVIFFRRFINYTMWMCSWKRQEKCRSSIHPTWCSFPSAFGAPRVCIKTFFLRNFETLLMNHGDIRNFMNFVIDESYSDDLGRQKLWKAFENAEKCHKNFYELNYIDKDGRNKYIESVEYMKTFFSEVNEDTMRKSREILWPNGKIDSIGKQFSYLTRELPNESTVAFGTINITYKYLSKSYT